MTGRGDSMELGVSRNIISKNEQFIDMLGSMMVIRRDGNQ